MGCCFCWYLLIEESDCDQVDGDDFLEDDSGDEDEGNGWCFFCVFLYILLVFMEKCFLIVGNEIVIKVLELFCVVFWC